MSITINKSVGNEIDAKVPNEDEMLEYYQAGKISPQSKQAYESYIRDKYGDDATDMLDTVADSMRQSDMDAMELQNQYGSIRQQLSGRIPKVIDAIERELNNTGINQSVQLRSLNDIANFASGSSENTKAIKEALVSAIDRVSSGGNKMSSIIKTVVNSVAYAALKTVQYVSCLFMLTVLAWPYLVIAWPVQGTMVIVSAILGVFAPAEIAERVDNEMYRGLL